MAISCSKHTCHEDIHSIERFLHNANTLAFVIARFFPGVGRFSKLRIPIGLRIRTELRIRTDRVLEFADRVRETADQ